MKEKKPLLTSQDFGKDEDSVVSLIKKLNNVDRDLSSFKTTVEKLQGLCNKITERAHFDAENVDKKMVRILS